MRLAQQQRIFAQLVAKLILWVAAQPGNSAVRFGEAYRTPEQAKLDADKGTGIANSLHCERLAIDLILDVDGIYQANSAAYKKLGEYWKSLHPLCRWGGDFTKADGNHFSMEWGGVQ